MVNDILKSIQQRWNMNDKQPNANCWMQTQTSEKANGEGEFEQ